jgi:hypothetical protein
MDAPGRRATFGVAGIENGQGFDRSETETDRLSRKRPIEGSESRRREGAEIGRARVETADWLDEGALGNLERAVKLEKLAAAEPTTYLDWYF